MWKTNEKDLKIEKQTKNEVPTEKKEGLSFMEIA